MGGAMVAGSLEVVCTKDRRERAVSAQGEGVFFWGGVSLEGGCWRSLHIKQVNQMQTPTPRLRLGPPQMGRTHRMEVMITTFDGREREWGKAITEHSVRREDSETSNQPVSHVSLVSHFVLPNETHPADPYCSRTTHHTMHSYGGIRSIPLTNPETVMLSRT